MSKFGGIPVTTEGASKFGGIPLPASRVVDYGDARAKYWQAVRVGDSAGAYKAQRQLADQGIDISEEDEPNLQDEAGRNAVAGMSGLDRYAAAIGGGLKSAGRGIGQLAVLATQGPNANYQQLKKNESEQRVVDRPLDETDAGFGGKVTAAVAPFIAGGLAGAYLKSPELVSAILPRSVPGAMVQGAALGGMQPLGADQDEFSRLINTGVGSAVGGLSAGGPRVVANGYNTVRGLSPSFTARMQAEQAGKILMDSAHDPNAVRLALSQNQVIVPGTRPSVAEATGDVGLAGLHRTLANTPDYGNALSVQNSLNNTKRVQTVRNAFGNANAGSEAAQREAVRDAQGAAINEAKRQTGAETGKVISAIDRVSRSPRFINAPPVQQALQTVRGLITTPLDDAARLKAARGVVTDALSSNYRKSSANHDALLEARRLLFGAQNRGEGADETIKALGKIKADGQTRQVIGDMQRALRVTERGKPDVASLYNARKHITQTLMKRADAETMTALRGVVKNLDTQIEAVAPSYRQYLTEYAGGMRKADQMAVGDELLDASSAIRDKAGNPVLSPAKFSNAGADLDQTVRRASGFQRATADKTMTVPQKQTVDAIRRDLERLSRSMTDGKAVGSNTVQNAIGGNTLQSAAGPVGAAMIEPVSGVALLALNAMRKQYGEKTYQILQEAMLDPQKAADLIARLPAQQRGQAVRTVAAHIGSIAAPVSANITVSRK